MKHTRTVIIVALLALLAGCGRHSDRGTVCGTVTLDAKPVECGSIVFIPIDGVKGVSVGGQIKDGQYRLSADKGPAFGMNRVEIRASRKTGRMIPKGLGGTGETVAEEVEGVAAKFNTASKLTLEVKTGDNVKDFEVTSK